MSKRDAQVMADWLMLQNQKCDIALVWPVWDAVLRNVSDKMIRKIIMEGLGTEDEYNHVLSESQRRKKKRAAARRKR